MPWIRGAGRPWGETCLQLTACTRTAPYDSSRTWLIHIEVFFFLFFCMITFSLFLISLLFLPFLIYEVHTYIKSIFVLHISFPSFVFRVFSRPLSPSSLRDSCFASSSQIFSCIGPALRTRCTVCIFIYLFFILLRIIVIVIVCSAPRFFVFLAHDRRHPYIFWVWISPFFCFFFVFFPLFLLCTIRHMFLGLLPRSSPRR